MHKVDALQQLVSIVILFPTSNEGNVACGASDLSHQSMSHFEKATVFLTS